MDQAGNLYGTAASGGNFAACDGGCGTAFKMEHKGSGWIFTLLYTFGGSDGNTPQG